MFSCTDDDTISPAIETSTEVQKIITKRLPFEQTPHYLTAKTIINQMSQNLNQSTLHNKGQEATETFEILTNEVIYMEYEDSHSYTFKVRRSNPEYYIENVVLHYNPETKEYDEFLMQYLVNEQEYLAIVNDDFSLDDVPIIAKKFENGTFSNILSRTTCKTTCNTVNVNCTTEYNHAPGETCNAAPDQQPYTYISCSTFCYVDVSIGDEDSPGGGNGGSGGGGNANTIPFPMEPCQTGGSGSGHTGPNTGINDGNGMCVVPWIAAMNSQLKLTQAELRVLRDYPDWFTYSEIILKQWEIMQIQGWFDP